MASISDYFIAGAKDFGDDVKNTIAGRSQGPSFTHRLDLRDSEDKSGRGSKNG